MGSEYFVGRPAAPRKAYTAIQGRLYPVYERLRTQSSALVDVIADREMYSDPFSFEARQIQY
jgi:hypothetical protein